MLSWNISPVHNAMDIIKGRFHSSQTVGVRRSLSWRALLKSASETKFTLIGIMALALLPRLWLLTKVNRIGLGYDELQSVTHANLPVRELLQSVRLYDPHPPLYYIQLHFWMYLGNSDLWLKSNSVLWSVLTAVSLYIIARRVFDHRVALLAGSLFSIAAFSISYSVEVRMYAFLMFLGVWVYYFTHQFLKGRNMVLAGSGLLLTQLAFLYSHGAGFLIFASVISYAILLALFREKVAVFNTNVFIRFGAIQLITLIVYSPWLWHANYVHVDHTFIPGLRDLAFTFAQLLFGTMIVMVKSQGTILGFAFILMLLISIVIFVNRKSRVLAIAFVFVPVAVALSISYLVRPIWVTWTLAYIVPFLSLGIAIFAADVLSGITPANVISAKRLGGLVIVGIFCLSTLTGVFYQQYNYAPWSHLKAAVNLVRQNAGPGNIVIVPHVRVYWGVSWYYLGPESFNPLEPDYLVPAEEGVWLISAPRMQKFIGDGWTYWVIYRTSDNMTNFFKGYDYAVKEIAGTFVNVVVERVQISEY
jgi:uncharacterized membrane protein